METINKDLAFTLIDSLIQDNFKVIAESENNSDFKLGIIDANKRLIEIQKTFI